VVFDREHELAGEVLEYQRQRTRRLMLQNQRGFAAELLAKESLGKRKPKGKGFGG
jgi:predicted nucleic acid-binding Zn ribbon protein